MAVAPTFGNANKALTPVAGTVVMADGTFEGASLVRSGQQHAALKGETFALQHDVIGLYEIDASSILHHGAPVVRKRYG